MKVASIDKKRNLIVYEVDTATGPVWLPLPAVGDQLNKLRVGDKV